MWGVSRFSSVDLKQTSNLRRAPLGDLGDEVVRMVRSSTLPRRVGIVQITLGPENAVYFSWSSGVTMPASSTSAALRLVGYQHRYLVYKYIGSRA